MAINYSSYRYRSQAEMEKQTESFLRRSGRRQTLFRLPGDEAGSWRTVKHIYDAGVEKYLVGKYGEVVVIANRDFAAASRSAGAFKDVDNRPDEGEVNDGE